MVGVPGRSKGCVTCRKRKKGCDLKQPECGQCKERGIACGGYDLDRVFIYQSTELSFASKGDQDATTSIRAKSFAPPLPSREMRVTPVRSVSETGNRSPSQPRPISVILPAGLTRSAYSEKSVEAFLHMYIPRGDFRDINIEGKVFIKMLPMLSIRDEALQMAVLAIGTAALGKTTGDADLIRQGRSFYGRALKETAVALRNPTRAKGEVAMIVSRGPEAYSQSEEAHLLFVNARFRPLIAAVRKREATILNDERWKTLPWRGRVKTPNDTLLDILCGVPELLEAVDILAATSAGEKRTEGLRVHTIANCWTLHLQLQAWLTANPNEIYTPMSIDSTTPISFHDLETACLTVRYWVTGLLIYSSLDIASGIQLHTDTSTSHHDRPHPRYFARLIARSVAYFFQEKFGITGATAISFPLGKALYHMNRNPGVDREYMAMIMRTWNNPMLPSAIRDFLVSMRRTAASQPTFLTPARHEEVC